MYVLPEVKASLTNQEHQSNSCRLERFFTDHVGAALQLAARHTAINSVGKKVCLVIVLGSMDCTFHTWDLNPN